MRGKRPRNTELSKNFGRRLKELFGDMSFPKVAERLDGIVSTVTLWDYVNGLSMPRPDVLLKISEKFDVSVDWLLKGEGTSPAIAEKQAEYQAGPVYDSDVMSTVISAVEELIEAEGLSIKPEKKAELITLLYEDSMEERIETEEIKVRLHRLLRLAT